MRAHIVIAGLSAALGCAGCGFKGPLYLPGRSSAVVTHPAPPAKAKRKNGRTGTTQGSAGPG